MDDLWPDNIAQSNLVTPVSILKEQAALLGEKTKMLVQGEVVTQAQSATPLALPFVHRFYIVAPTISYRYELFSVSHGVNFYPLSINYAQQTTTCMKEEQFKEKLKEILAAEHTMNVVHSLLAQVR